MFYFYISNNSLKIYYFGIMYTVFHTKFVNPPKICGYMYYL